MKIYVNEKDIKLMTEEIRKDDCPLTLNDLLASSTNIVESLEQHDKEFLIKVMEELEEWTDKHSVSVFTDNIILKSNLEQKLNELKGEKDRLTEKSPLHTNVYGVSSKLVCNITESGDWFDNGTIFYTGKAIKKLVEYEQTNLSPSEVEQLKKENEKLKLNWNNLCDYLGTEIANDKDCENGCLSEILDRVNDIRKYDCKLKSEQNKIAIEKLEKILDFIYSNKWTNIELCVDNSPLKIIRNKLYTMLAELKGE